MSRYVAFLRGVTPLNARMAELKRCFERAASPAAVERRIEAAMARHLGRKSDPYRKFRLPAKAKRVVTFLRSRRKSKLGLPLELDGAKILTMKCGEAFTAYARGTR